jgi:hypothetical protein
LAATQMIDPTRPFLDASGYHHLYAGTDVFDSHNYNQNPEAFRAQFSTFALTGAMPFQNHPGKELPYAGQPYFVSEYGGTKLKHGDEPEDRRKAWGYGNSAEDVDAFMARYKGLTDVLLDNPNCFGFCYTQLTDIEQEQNGVYFYDRRPKYDPARMKAINQRPAAYETQGPRIGKLETKTILEDSRRSPQMWRYTLEKPADNWYTPDFDDSAWKEGKGGFGREKTPGAVIGTTWTTDDIWIRQTFDVKDMPRDNVFLVIHHDEDAEVYINGKLIATFAQYTTDYILADVTEKIRGLLRPGQNLIAAHCHQTVGGQYIDVGIQNVTVIESDD